MARVVRGARSDHKALSFRERIGLIALALFVLGCLLVVVYLVSLMASRVPTAAPTTAPVARVVPTVAPAVRAVPTATTVVDRTPRRLGTAVRVGWPADTSKVLLVTAMASSDNVPAEHRFNAAKGRWYVVDWRVDNAGAVDVRLGSQELVLQTAGGYVIEPTYATVREPRLDSRVIGPGQTMRGFLAYDVPSDQQPTAAIYQPQGSRQILIAEILER